MDQRIKTSELGSGQMDQASRENRVCRLSDGRLLGYADYGAADGIPVIALHGTPGSRFMFQLADWPARERGLRLVAPERPGYALSSEQPGRALADCPGDVEELADQLGIDRFAVAGVSGGGAYAAACAAMLGSRISATALVSPVGPFGHADLLPRLTMAERHLFMTIARSPWRSRLLFGSVRWFQNNTPGLTVAAIISRSGAADKAILRRPEIAANLIEALSEGLRPGLSGAMQDLRLYSMPWNLPLDQVKARCAIWHGGADHIVPFAAAEALARQMQSSEFIQLPGAGHYWVYDNFDEVLDWLAKHGR